MVYTKIPLFIIKFTCDKPKVTTTLIVYDVFQQKLQKTIINSLKHKKN